MQLAAGAIAALIAVHWIFMKILKIAMVKGLVDNPDIRKLQKNPVPVLGGIAVFFGFLFGLLAYAGTSIIVDEVDRRVVAQGALLLGTGPALLGASIMLYVGALDDIMGLSPLARIVIETLVILGIIYGSGMCIDSFHGLWGIFQFSWNIAVPLTVFACVGIINAYNMVDGVNGLSSGLCMACSSILGAVFFKRGDLSNAAMAFCFAGALLPFYIHNVFGKRSKMFIGDAGTMVMGMLVSWFIIRVLSSQNETTIITPEGRNMCLVALMLAIASVPVFDTLRVMTGRILRGVSPLKADKTHLHHVFIATGISHLVTSLSELIINLLVVMVWLICYRSGMSQEAQLYIVIVSSALLVWGSYGFLHYQQKYHTKTFERFNRWSRFTHLGHRPWWIKLQAILDRGADYKDWTDEKENLHPNK